MQILSFVGALKKEIQTERVRSWIERDLQAIIDIPDVHTIVQLICGCIQQYVTNYITEVI